MLDEYNFYKIWVNKKHIGTLTKEIDRYGVEKYSFEYNQRARLTDVVSLSMPVRSTPYISKGKIHNVFLQNMPSGHIKACLNQWTDRKHPGELSDWQILGMIGQNQIGRVSITPESVQEIISNPPSSFKMNEILNSVQNENIFEDLMQNSMMSDAVTGNQPKVARSVIDDIQAFGGGGGVLTTSNRTIIAEDVIIKGSPPMQRYPFLCMNEYLCSLTSRAARIPTAIIRPNRDLSINVIQRFDRKIQYGKVYRFGFDDGLTILPYIGDVEHSLAKYNSSYEKLAKGFISRLSLHADHINFFKRVSISLALRDGDAHLQNFGIIYNKNGAWLSAAYDISMTAVYYKKNHFDERTSPYDEPMALTMFGSHSYPDANGLLEYGIKHCKLTREEAVVALSEIDSAVTRLRDGGVKKSLSSKNNPYDFNVPEQIIDVFDNSFNNLTMNDLTPSKREMSKIHQVPGKIEDVSIDMGV